MRIEAAASRLAHAIERGSSDDELTEMGSELRDVVEEAAQLLETVDLESLPDVVDIETLPNLVDVEGISTAIEEHDPDAALDLRAIRHAIRLRELWNSVDLVGFTREKNQLTDELADVVGADALEGTGNSDSAVELRRYAAEIRPDAKNAAVSQQAQKATLQARTRLLTAHANAEGLYEANKRASGRAGRRSQNPTAVSLVPAGPVPASVSTRFSSVPSNVRGGKIDALPRIYGRRWRSGNRGRNR